MSEESATWTASEQETSELAVDSMANSQIQVIVRDPTHGHFVKGHPVLPGAGRPKRGSSFADLAKNLTDEEKQQIIQAIAKKARAGSVRHFEALADRAEGKPAVTIKQEESPLLAELLQRYAQRRAELEEEEQQ